MSYLTRYPLSRIKIDRSFVKKIGDSFSFENSGAIVRAIIVMAHNLGLEVSAEGVESPVQAAFFRAEKCDEVQGFCYATALPAHDFEEFVRSKETQPHALAG